MMEWIAVIAVAVVLALGLRAIVRYAAGQMRGAAREYRVALARDEIESVLGWLERQRQQPHG